MTRPSDPRTAALAEALHDIWPHADCRGTAKACVAIVPVWLERAAAILAVLPPMAWDDLSYEAGLEDGRKESGAEIASLRKIEEAAREVVEQFGEYGGPPVGHSVAALRAALEKGAER